MKSTQDRGNRLEEEIFKFNRIQEENVGLKKKLDKAKRMEYLGASDEILVEEVKMYKVSCYWFYHHQHHSKVSVNLQEGQSQNSSSRKLEINFFVKLKKDFS